MKIRIGFVSNSSSSSFVIIGKLFEFEDFKNAFNIDFKDFDFDKIKSWDLQTEFETYIARHLPNLKFEVKLYGGLGSHNRVIVYNVVPDNPDKAIEVIKRTVELFGNDRNVSVNCLKDDSESGIYFGE